MSGQQIIDPKDERYQRYQKHLTVALAAFDHGAGSEAEGWWNLWVIERDEEWKSEFGDDKVGYLGSLTLQPYAPSQGAYYERLGPEGAIRNWQKLGFHRSREIKWLLKNYKMALGPDLGLLMDGDGFRPDIEREIKEGHETAKEFVKRVAELGRSEARREVLGKVFKDRFFFHREGAVFDERRQIILANLQHEHEEKGIVGVYTLSLKCTNTQTGKVEMPLEVAQFLADKLGILLNEIRQSGPNAGD